MEEHTLLTLLRVLGREHDELGPLADPTAGPPGMGLSLMNASSVGGRAYIPMHLHHHDTTAKVQGMFRYLLSAG